MCRTFALAASATFIVLLAAAIGPAWAQEPAYPARNIKLIVPFGPGGPTDVIARAVSQILRNALGQSVVTENKPGAGGALGTRFVAQADPDGYTLLLGTVATLSAVPAVQKNPGFDPVKSFAAVAKLTESTTVLAIPAQLPFRTVAELVAHAKANPGKLNYGSAGVGNQTQLNAELFKFKTGADIVHIPYKSGAEMVASLLANETQLAFLDMSILLPQIEAGKIRALAVTSRVRHPAMPDAPTMIESGVPEFSAVFWTGVLAPAETPQPIVDKLNAALNRGLDAPDIRELLSRIKAEAKPASPREFADYVASEAQKWRDAVKLAGIEAE